MRAVVRHCQGGAQRTDASHHAARFMAPIHVRILEVFALHEPGGASVLASPNFCPLEIRARRVSTLRSTATEDGSPHRSWPNRTLVAQVSNLPYRRLPVGQTPDGPSTCRLEIRDTAQRGLAATE